MVSLEKLSMAALVLVNDILNDIPVLPKNVNRALGIIGDEFGAEFDQRWYASFGDAPYTESD